MSPETGAEGGTLLERASQKVPHNGGGGAGILQKDSGFLGLAGWSWPDSLAKDGRSNTHTKCPPSPNPRKATERASFSFHSEVKTQVWGELDGDRTGQP